MRRKITQDAVRAFREYLFREEKSGATLARYLHDTERFFQWTNGEVIEKDAVLAYKAELVKTYSVASVNSILSSLNSFFRLRKMEERRRA